MLTVRFFSVASGAGQEVGSVTWDGKRLRATGPQVEDVLYSPIHMSEGKPVPPDKEPERFLRALPYIYRSPYFYAGKIEES